MDGKSGHGALTPTRPHPQPRGAPSLLLGQAGAECTAHTCTVGRNASPPPLGFLWMVRDGNYTKPFCGASAEHSERSSRSLLLNKAPHPPAHPTVTQVSVRHRGLAFPSGAAFNDLTSLLRQILLKDVQNRCHLL